MLNLPRFVRSVSPADLRRHLDQSEIPIPTSINWDASGERFTRGFLKALSEIPEQKRIQLTADFDRVSGMTDEVGQAALMALPEWREKLHKIDGAYRRAHWLYMQSPEAFRQAEEIRFAD